MKVHHLIEDSGFSVGPRNQLVRRRPPLSLSQSVPQEVLNNLGSADVNNRGTQEALVSMTSLSIDLRHNGSTFA